MGLTGRNKVCLARVDSGWTGNIVITHVATSVAFTLTPSTRESVASVVERFLEGAKVAFSKAGAAAPTAHVNDSLKLVVNAAAEFNLTGSGTTFSRVGFTGSKIDVLQAEGDTAYTGAVSHTGIECSYSPARTTVGPPAADGVLGVPGINATQTGKLVMIDSTFSNSIVIEGEVDDGATYDLWLAGRVIKRFRAGVVTRVRAGFTASRCTLELGGSEVSM